MRKFYASSSEARGKFYATSLCESYFFASLKQTNRFVFTFTGAENFQCPAETGTFADIIQCDKYYECRDGVAKEHLCADGLVFDENIKRFSKCDQPFNVDCGDRTELRKLVYWGIKHIEFEPNFISQEIPRGTSDYCRRKNGIFGHPNETICPVSGRKLPTAETARKIRRS